MGFLKKLFGGEPAKPEKRYYVFQVKCNRCGEVIEGRVDGRRWTTGIRVPGIDVTIADNPRPARRPGLVLRVKTPFMKGEIVKEVQRKLRAAKFHAGPIDGVYGPQTAAAVQAFQAAKGAVPDGEVGAGTAKLLKVDWV